MGRAERQAKIGRGLDMYVRLCEGKLLNKTEEARRFGVDERSIQRDIDDIRAFIAERSAAGQGGREVIYDRAKKGFLLVGGEGSMMTNSEILAVSKILLESRAFTKKQISAVLGKMVAGCVPLRNMKLVSDLIANEKYHYVELPHQSGIQDKLWELGEDIKAHAVLEIAYRKQGATESETVKRLIEPVALIFSEYYFYLNAYIVERGDNGERHRRYDYPAVFRVDRIVSWEKTGELFRIEYASRFEEGVFRKRVQFMYPGKLVRLRFRYSGVSVEAILDRLPTATVVSQDEKGYILDAEVYGKGVLMWLLGQGSNVEVLEPPAMRDEMRRMLTETLANY